AATAARPAAQAGTGAAAGGGGGTLVQTAPASIGAISSQLSYAGGVQASQQVNVVPKTSGIISQIYADVGQPVRTGDLIAQLDPGSLPQQLLQAQAALQAAQAKLAQVEAGALPSDVAAARSQLDQANTTLQALFQPRPEDVQAAQANLDAARA